MRNLVFVLLALLPLPVLADSLDDFLTFLSTYSISVESVLLVLLGTVIGIGVTAVGIFFAIRFLKWARKVA